MIQLGAFDIIVIVTFFAIIFGIAIYYSRKAGRDTNQFFLSGRNLPWYIAGTAMVATTFAADTPLAVTELVAKNGIAGNWLWWNMAIGAMLTVFFFAKLWRRSGVITDVEFIEFRYSGRSAAILRGFKAIYLGLFMNAIVMAWVHKAMEKIFQVVLPDWDPFLLVVIVAVLIAVYASASGLLGTSRTDSIQFIFAMAGCIILAIIVVRIPQVNGVANLKAQLAPEVINFLPTIGGELPSKLGGGVLALTVGAFIAYVGVQWWSSWYPGADPGGGGYIAQRMMSAKDEKHSMFATLWFTIAHYAVRPWPWIIVALAALVILPRADSTDELEKENPAFYQLAKDIKEGNVNATIDNYGDADFIQYYEKYENTVDPGIMYPKLMVKYLPNGLLGLLIAVFLAAYMSTIASQLNWGTSYLVNDFYKRFINPQGNEREYVLVSRILIIFLVLFSLLVTWLFITKISGAWEFIINASAGMGAVLILRWYWWRINAWSEIVAMIVPIPIYFIVKYHYCIEPPLSLFPTVLGTTIIWIITTLLTPAEKDSVLQSFYTKVNPIGRGWGKYSSTSQKSIGQVWILIRCWIYGVVLVYFVLFGVGKLIFGDILNGIILLCISIFLSVRIWILLKQIEKTI